MLGNCLDKRGVKVMGKVIIGLLSKAEGKKILVTLFY